jgi:hypothetical protein
MSYVLKPLKLPRNMSARRNARSELAKSSVLAMPPPRPPRPFDGAAVDPVDVEDAGAAVEVEDAAGAAGAGGGSKPAGFGTAATSSRFLIACPASRMPGFRPTRGSLDTRGAVWTTSAGACGV